MRKIAFLVFLAVVSFSWTTSAQDAVPGEMLARTLFIKAGELKGTAFAIDFQGKKYLVTARHVISGLPSKNAVIQVWQENQWKDYETVKTIFPSSDEVDIAVFETKEKIAKPYMVTASLNGVAMGAQVWFLGYPWGIGSEATRGGGRFFAPFIKRGTMSAIDGTKPNAVILYIDGFNNPGFSGGPIIYWDVSKRAYAIIGVVKGYREDSAKIVVNGQHVDTNLLVNSGILIGYGIDHALSAIKDSNNQIETPK